MSYYSISHSRLRAQSEFIDRHVSFMSCEALLISVTGNQ